MSASGCLRAMRKATLLYFFLVAVAQVRANPLATEPHVATTSGRLHGTRTQTDLGSVQRYLGVPYAKPPVGVLRFRPPLKLDREAAGQERMAARFGSMCVQPPHVKDAINPLLFPEHSATMKPSEDCLNLNVFVPDLADNKGPLPVMVWLPGEGFDYSDASQFDGSALSLLGRVIVVTVNYRVSVFGFLSTLSHHAPGNVGLQDQRMALVWVKENARNFGGDPLNITLFGRFTGSMSAAMHLTSPLSKGLFSRVILQSGIPTGKWIFDDNPVHAAHLLAEKLRCPVGLSYDDMISCLQEVPSDVLLKASLKVPHTWRPVIDGYFLKEKPLDAIAEARVPPVDVLIGVNSNEGSLCLLMLYAFKSPHYNALMTNTIKDDDLKELFNFHVGDFLKTSDAAIKKRVFQKYSNTSISPQQKYLKFCGDMYITSPSIQLAQLLSKLENIRLYVYEFAHRPSFSIYPSFIQAAHGDDILFSFGLARQSPSVSQEEVALSSKLVSALSNFARNSDPNPVGDVSWPQFTTAKPMMKQFTTSMDTSPIREADTNFAEFWASIVRDSQQDSQLIVA